MPTEHADYTDLKRDAKGPVRGELSRTTLLSGEVDALGLGAILGDEFPAGSHFA